MTALTGAHTANAKRPMIGYRSDGAGDPVVLVHGNVADQEVWCGSVSAIAKKFTVIQPTMSYFGLCAWPDDGENFSLDAHSDDLVFLLENLELPPATLVGWSYGAAACLCVAAKRPELVGRLVLFEPTLVTALTNENQLAAALLDRTEMTSKAFECVQRGNLSAAAEAFIDGVNDRPGTFGELSSILQAVFLRNARTLAPTFAGPPPPSLTSADLGRLCQPTTLFLGESSRPFWQLAVPAIAALIPDARLSIVEDARHMWPVNEPEAFSRLVLAELMRPRS